MKATLPNEKLNACRLDWSQAGQTGLDRKATTKSLATLVVTLLSTFFLTSNVRADLVRFNFTGQVIEIENPTNPGVWGGANMADPLTLQVSGQFSYDSDQVGVPVSNGLFYYWSNFQGSPPEFADTGFASSMTLNGEMFSYVDNGLDENIRRQAVQSNDGEYDSFGIYSLSLFADSQVAENLNLNLPDGWQVVGKWAAIEFEYATRSTPLGSLPIEFDISGKDSLAYGLMSVNVIDSNGSSGGLYNMIFLINSVTPVPEPSSGVLVGLLACGMGLIRRRRFPHCKHQLPT